MNIGDKIKKIRTDIKMTQKELATAADISEISIRKYESGERFPKYETIQNIADALGTSVSHLMSISNSFSIELLAAIQKSYRNKFHNCSIENLFFLETLSNELNINNEILFDVFYDKSKDLPIPIQKELLNFFLQIDPDSYYEFVKSFNFDMSPEIKFLSNPNVEKVFNYSFNELAKSGYQELLILAIEKAIKNTLDDINTHLEAGDLFDGVHSWINKESPLYEVLKEIKSKNNKENK